MTRPVPAAGSPARWRAAACAAGIAALALSGCSARSTTATTSGSAAGTTTPAGTAAAATSGSVSGSAGAPASAPAETAGSGSDADAVSVVITDQGCTANHLTVPAGTVTFRISSTGSGAVTEVELQRGSRILGERENIVPGLTGKFSITLDPGSYSLYCPGGSGPGSQPFTVTPAAG